jgi:hypothetical protein
VYDPLVPAEMAANSGELLAHYQVPLIDNATNLFMESGRSDSSVPSLAAVGVDVWLPPARLPA